MEIEGYEDYLIYDDGRLWSKKRKIFKKHVTNKKGYLRVQLCKNSKVKNFYIHRLVALHYIPNPDNKSDVDHINDNPSDNKLENLQWLTGEENNDKRNIPSNTGEKFISKSEGYYYINKKNCFSEYLNCSKYTLQDAINLRDALLSIENDVV